MKKAYLKWIGITSIICVIGFALLGAAENPETAAVKSLLEKRTNVMENVLLGKITYEEGKEQLKKIETDKLYSDDLNNLQQYQDTDFEEVKNMKIIKIEKRSHVYDMMTFNAEIGWTYAGPDGMHTRREKYQIGVTESDDEYKLISLEIQSES